ncbi:MAG: LON peptidase substrate-binding domain-containing protein [Alphaproteobacteria bacterium]|jgi:Lon protease-like protein|nr:LON peptidase substrate-binding domain-containing protein [Alphaproteobacteria bacterium]
MSAFGYRKPQDLPEVIPIFPLPGAILFPRSTLPLNIFEPRYLNMIDDALAGKRLIGMIQPTERSGAIAEIGAVGRITAFAETDDGRYLITLTGVARFRVVEELSVDTPYRQVRADFASFNHDLSAPGFEAVIDRNRLRGALRRYVDMHGFETDWSAVDEAPPEALVNAVATLCPFDSIAKQALLEAEDLVDRCAVLIALLEMSAESGGAEGPMQ